ncbi:HD-GYP domain-containing protein [Phycicoccus flavus]|uniref:HD domain-containing protein n=1 Tax=Phycicoccus flavus TaxID=2502783 RepID=A0A8T6QY36_9MICO|nr:HD domain-containing phosphohydrolase [Phycicoccus flavus]NHA66879.1 HD domain-containing protein [Phycicoccus flavus]
MTERAPDERGGGPDSRDTATQGYIAVVVLLAVGLLALVWHELDVSLDGGFVVFVVLVVALRFVPEAVVEGRTQLSLSSTLLLSCQAIVGPAGAGVLGALLGGLQGRSLPAQYRVFNAAQNSVMGTLGGLAFAATGGDVGVETVGEALRSIALPLFVADLVQVVGNLVLLSGVVMVSGTGSLRTTTLPLLRSTGPAYVGYGSIALIMVVLWEPAMIGATSALLVLAPLLVAQWAYRQHAEDLRGQDQVLQVLVAAVEAKAPHLAGHSARVAALSQRLAEDLGLGPRGVADARLAGMLHDLGQTTMPTGLVRESTTVAAEAGYPARGAALLTHLGFLAGTLDPIARHREALDERPDGSTLVARIVGVSDTYDLLTAIGDPDGRVLTPTEALDRIRTRPGVDDRLMAALESAVLRAEVRSGA